MKTFGVDGTDYKTARWSLEAWERLHQGDTRKKDFETGTELLSTDPEIRLRFPALPDFLRSSGFGTESTQPREYNWGATWKKSSDFGLETEITAVGIRRADHATPLYQQKLALTSPTSEVKTQSWSCQIHK
jgi:hypothetical protein